MVQVVFNNYFANDLFSIIKIVTAQLYCAGCNELKLFW
ncbi:MAG: hypothetical protein JWR61_4023 [Ferruginibacter sp.]|nr:hypothetical protein [Ferruginibacter sp.]